MSLVLTWLAGERARTAGDLDDLTSWPPGEETPREAGMFPLLAELPVATPPGCREEGVEVPWKGKEAPLLPVGDEAATAAE